MTRKITLSLALVVTAFVSIAVVPADAKIKSWLSSQYIVRALAPDFDSDNPGVFALLGNRVIHVSFDGEVERVAGKETAGFSDGVSENAEFDNPRGIVHGRDNALYIADTQNNRIRRVDLQTKMVSTIAGHGESWRGSTDHSNALAAGISLPVALAMNSQGDLFFTEIGKGTVRQLSRGENTADVSTVDNGQWSITGVQLNALAFDQHDNFFFTDTRNRTLHSLIDRKFESNIVGEYWSPRRELPFAGQRFSLPEAIAVSPDGQFLFVADEFDGTLTIVDRKHQTLNALLDFENPRSVITAPDGGLFVADYFGIHHLSFNDSFEDYIRNTPSNQPGGTQIPEELMVKDNTRFRDLPHGLRRLLAMRARLAAKGKSEVLKETR